MVFKEMGKELPEQWVPKKDGEFLQGIYKNKKENVGTNKANLYIVESKGILKSIWGSTVLDDKMCYVSVGDLIRITYKGKTKKYHDFMVERDVLEDNSEEDEEEKPEETEEKEEEEAKE